MSLNPFPAVAYRIQFPGAKLQAVHGSERPGAAMVAAYASWRRGEKLLGAVRNLTIPQCEGVFQAACREIGIPWSRMNTWAQGINEEKITTLTAPVGGLTPSMYQVLAAGQLTVAGGVLAMAVGLGKTVTAVVAARAYAQIPQVNPSRCWIICPLAAIPAWAAFLPD